MELFITRHGQTIANIKHIFQGQSESPLTDKGIEQAKKLAQRFKNENIDIVYSSDLSRASDTAREIIKYHPNIKLHLDKRIRERYLGALQETKVPKGWNWENLPSNVESDKDMYARTKEFLDEIYAKNKNKTVLIVCHNGVKKALLTIIYNKPLSEMNDWHDMPNTAVSKFKIKEDGNHKVHILNCDNHL